MNCQSPTPILHRKEKKDSSQVATFPQVPKCICGSNRYFEFQLMPSVLHVLKCDDHAHKSCTSHENYGGMNWGVLAVYSCSQSCSQSIEEFVVVQESADGEPVQRNSS